MSTHSLKTARPYWFAIERGEKRFEVRRDDRGFQKGDTLLLRLLHADGGHAFETPDGSTTGLEEHARTIRATVDWILTGGQLGVEPGFVVMSITPEWKGTSVTPEWIDTPADQGAELHNNPAAEPTEAA